MRRNIIAAFTLLLCGAGLTGAAVAQQPVKLGVLNDQTGLYADLSGMGSVHAARMAVEDFGGKVLGRPIEVIFADHQNKPDIGANIARQWIETEAVTLILDVPNSAVGLAVREVTRTRDAVDINTAPPRRISPEKPVRRMAYTRPSTPTALRRRPARRW